MAINLTTADKTLRNLSLGEWRRLGEWRKCHFGFLARQEAFRSQGMLWHECGSIVPRQGGSSKAVSWWQLEELDLGHQEWQIGQCQGQVLQRGFSGDRRTVKVVWGVWSSEEKYLSSKSHGREEGRKARRPANRCLSGTYQDLKFHSNPGMSSDFIFWSFTSSTSISKAQIKWLSASTYPSAHVST